MIIPETIAIESRIPIISKVFFLEGFVLKRTARATPELTSNPEIIAPAERLPFRYKSVIITLEAQLGTNPTIDARILLSTGLSRIIVFK